VQVVEIHPIAWSEGGLNLLNNIESKIREILAEIIEFQIPVSQICVYDELKNWGVDSVSYIKMLVSLEEEFLFETDEDFLAYNSLPNIKAIIEYVQSKIQNI